jgi:plastocyanin
MLCRAALLLAVVTGLALVATPAEATPAQVSIHDFVFDPKTVTVPQGGTVMWTNDQPAEVHTATSNEGFWDSGDLHTGDTYRQVRAFLNAGTYGYHCMHHTFMHGTVKVPLKLNGDANNGFTVRWSSASSAPANRNFDVQVKRPGATKFTGFRSATKALKAFFNPARAGTYKFRARTRIVSTGQTSGWSPVRSLAIS